jgi:hypothetical protein
VAPELDVNGPVFLSYRQSDGSAISDGLADSLNALGVPVWRDKSDLLPGDFRDRITSAFDAGLSGAVLVVTPDIANSTVVRELEAPRLLAFHEAHRAFTLAVLNAASDPIDHKAPDQLLNTSSDALADTMQYELAEVKTMVERVARRRMEEWADHHSGEALPLDVQSRLIPQAKAAKEGLVVRLSCDAARPSVPPRSSVERFGEFLAALPLLTESSNAARVIIGGGMHLSLAFGLGCALPSTNRWPVAVQTQDGLWDSEDATALAEEIECWQTAGNSGTELLVYVDLARDDGNRDAFSGLRASHPGAPVLEVSNGGREVDASQGAAIARRINAAIRAAAADAGTTRVHLCLRTPFAIAVLLGRLMNTLEVTMYEFDQDASRLTYVPVARYMHGVSPLVTANP